MTLREISERTLACARGRWWTAPAVPTRVAAVGITNQRETAVAGERPAATPVHRAIVWQDRRTTDTCRELIRQPATSRWSLKRTGLVLDPYFSATKFRWLLDHDPRRPPRASDWRGTVDTFLVFRLTGGAHVTDASNASRTLFLPLDGAGFDPGLCYLFGVPMGWPCRGGRHGWPDCGVRSRAWFGAAYPDLRAGRRSAGRDHRPGLPRCPARPRRRWAPERSSDRQWAAPSPQDRRIACSAPS